MKPLPPYGNYLDSNNGTVIIFLGSKGWERAKDFQKILPYTIFLPHRTSPIQYRWPVKKCEVYLCDTESSRISFIRFFALILFSYGANTIRYVSSTLKYNIEKGISK